MPEILRTTQLPQPLAQTAKKAKGASDPLWTFYAKPRHNAQFWDVQTRDFNSAVEDKLEEGRYNLILWEGLMGDGVPYPNIRDARDIRRNRQSLLKQWRHERILQLSSNLLQVSQMATFCRRVLAGIQKANNFHIHGRHPW